MKPQTFSCCMLVAALALAGSSASAQKFSPPPPSTSVSTRYSPDTAELVKLVQAKTSDAVVISSIKANPRAYHLTPQETSLLKRKGASSAVLAAITEHDRLIDSNQYEWAAGTPEAKQAKPQEEGKPAKAAPATEDVVRVPPPPAQSAPPPKPLKRTWTSTVVVEQSPPGPKLELVPLSPGPEYAWIPGRWAWREGQWNWQGGYWAKRPSPGMTWVDGYWAKHGKSWTWIEGRWK